MASAHDADNEWQRIAGTTQVLVRSRIEIARLLNEAVRRQNPVCAFFVGDKALFVSQLRQIDLDRDHVLLAYSNNRMANSALLNAGKTVFNCGHALGRMEFLGTHFAEASLDGDLVIRFAFPEMLVMNQRRLHRRIKALPEVPLDCIAGGNGMRAFACKITDISRGGVGAMVFDESVKLKPGMILPACKITFPGGAALVDIEIRHCTRVILADGKIAQQAGCRFVGQSAELERMIKMFVVDLEEK